MRIGRFVAAMLCCIPAGCRVARPEVAEVTGHVVRGGKPLPDVRVTFAPETTDKTVLPISTGTTDEGGAFRLTRTDGREGVAIGTYRIVLEDLRGQAQSAPASREDQDDRPVVRSAAPSRSRVPDQFQSAAISPLVRAVVAGTNSFELDLGP